LILGKNIILKGYASNNKPLVKIGNATAATKLGKLTMLNGSRITGNTSSASAITNGGGGVNVSTKSTFIMQGGVIDNNKCTASNGGAAAVLVYATSAANMAIFEKTGGTIKGNTSNIPAGSRHVIEVVLSTAIQKYRDTEAGPDVKLDSATETGWEN
jgi:hypothetical protein